tara:strand:+ start:4692 stop:4829 length:138 start_codon:yes stop_codon:yes gene_type:complete
MFLKDLFKKKLFMEWDDYMEKVKFIDEFLFQQKVRRDNVRNLEVT